MGKVFRLHTGDDNLVGWGDSSAYGNTAIREIQRFGKLKIRMARRVRKK